VVVVVVVIMMRITIMKNYVLGARKDIQAELTN
jgi:hypothetical protein